MRLAGRDSRMVRCRPTRFVPLDCSCAFKHWAIGWTLGLPSARLVAHPYSGFEFKVISANNRHSFHAFSLNDPFCVPLLVSKHFRASRLTPNKLLWAQLGLSTKENSWDFSSLASYSCSTQIDIKGSFKLRLAGCNACLKTCTPFLLGPGPIIVAVALQEPSSNGIQIRGFVVFGVISPVI